LEWAEATRVAAGTTEAAAIPAIRAIWTSMSAEIVETHALLERRAVLRISDNTLVVASMDKYAIDKPGARELDNRYDFKVERLRASPENGGFRRHFFKHRENKEGRTSFPRRDLMRKAMMIGLVALMAVAFATSPLSSVKSAVSSLCQGLTSLLPVAAMLMIVIAGVIYAAGQVMGAETRARANVWATAALTGALIGILIYAIAPSVLGAVYGGDIQSACTSVAP